MKYLSLLSVVFGIYSTSVCMEAQRFMLKKEEEVGKEIYYCYHLLHVHNQTNSPIKACFKGTGTSTGPAESFCLKKITNIQPQKKYTFEILLNRVGNPTYSNQFKMNLLMIRPLNDKNNKVIFYKPLKCDLNDFIVKEAHINQSLLMIENTNK